MKNWIIIGTDLDSKKFDQKYEKLKDRLKKENEVLDLKFGDLENAKKELSEVQEKFRNIKNEIDGVNKEIKEYEEKIKSIDERAENGTITKTDYLNRDRYGAKIASLKEQSSGLNIEYDKYNEKMNKVIDKLTKAELSYDNQVNKIKDINNQIGDLNNRQLRGQIDGIGKISNRITDIVKKVGRWALAIFGVRTAFNAIRTAMSKIMEDDKQLKADVDYIKNVIAYTLEPIVRSIIDFVKQGLIYLGYIIKQWTGVNIFENADRNLKNANKNAKELQKTVAKFDEMNIVSGNDNKEASFNLSDSVNAIKEGDIKWLDWIVENGKGILATIATIIAMIEGFKFGTLLHQGVEFVSEVLTPVGNFLIKHLPNILAIAAIIGGIIIYIKGLINYLKDPTWDNFFTMLGGLIAIVGGILALGHPIIALIVGIIGLIVMLGAVVYENWGKIKGWLTDAKDWIDTKIINPLKERIEKLPTWLQVIAKGALNIIVWLINHFIDTVNALLLPLTGTVYLIGKATGKNWDLGDLRIPRIQYFKNGGIINLPGKGVPIENRGGENGAEGILPLTNEEQMDLMGRSIAKYLSIELTNVIDLDSRPIARVVKKVMAQNDFLMNK